MSLVSYARGFNLMTIFRAGVLLYPVYVIHIIVTAQAAARGEEEEEHEEKDKSKH